MNRQGADPRPVTSVPCLLLCVLSLSGAVSPSVHAGVREAWVRQHAGVKQANAAANAVAIDAVGNVIVTGTADLDCFTVKYSSAGTMLWQRSYNGLADRSDRCAALALDAAGNVAVTGSAISSVWRGDSDWYVARYAAGDGSIIWERLIVGAGDFGESGNDFAHHVALDGNGNPIVFGTQEYGPAIGGQLSTMKFSESDGSFLFEFKNPSGFYAWEGANALALAADARGNVVTVGLERAISDNRKNVIAYYQANATTSHWSVVSRHANPVYDQPVAVAINGQGDVVVASNTREYPYGMVMALHVAKYAATDGAVLWGRRYTNAQSMRIAVDEDGDVFIAGGSGAQGTNGFLTLKYSGVDGALLWETRYGNATNNPGTAQRLAVDTSGNVVVTGNSKNERGNTDIYAAKYNGTDGGLMWEIRYNGAADRNDTVRGLALGPDGLVAVAGDSTGTNGVTSFTTILYQDDLPSLTIALVQEGVRLHSVGVDGSTYQIERAPSVTGPWEVIASPVATTSGLVEHLDTNRPPETNFYRMRKP